MQHKPSKKFINSISAIEKSADKPLYTLTVSEFELLLKSLLEDFIGHTEDQDTQKDSLLTRQEVCSFLHITYPTILKYEKRGLLTGRRIGHRVFYSSLEVREALK